MRVARTAADVRNDPQPGDVVAGVGYEFASSPRTVKARIGDILAIEHQQSITWATVEMWRIATENREVLYVAS